jgi:hypothetical protein
VRDAELETKGATDNKSMQYADDSDIVGRTVSSVKEAYIAPSAAAKTVRLNVN